ncbi:MAG: M13 family metallopeptidase [Roseateles sp.]|jgi:putative endopeptidase|uniref:Peptidase M13 n=7 Tax=cellular organisms TaxID=131567 RepID=A0A7S3XUY7_HETAK|nr:peptidase M13 [Methylibium sp.]|mmetsp:Transcript_91089/g.253697  ORF Transcript_91089/g.253697 Transcript_91089/m.253697 type:complete len:672 (+) Transcript_91089:727-2742(+)
MKNTLRLTTLALLMQVGALAWAGPSASGLDLELADKTVRPQDDLFRAGNGKWLATTEIPADKSSYGAFMQLRDLSDQRVRAIIEELAKGKHPAGAVEQKIGDYFAAYMDTAAIDKAGLAPVKPLLDSIAAIKDREQLAVWLGAHVGSVGVPVPLGIEADFKQPTINRLITWQGGLGLPDRDYYLKKDDERMAKARGAYETYLQTLAREAGLQEGSVQRVLAIEQRLAEAQWAKVDLRDPVKLYNPMTPAELAAQAPGFAWSSYFKAALLPDVDKLSVSQPSYVVAAAKVLDETPLDDLKAYLTLRALDARADVLPQAIRDAAFAFHGTALTGAKAERPRWQKAVDNVNGALGEAVGQVYVQRHFPAADKARMLTLVNNLLAAYKTSIDRLTWMTPATKAAAQDKLSKYMVKIGYPDNWRDYSKLEVRAGDALGNDERANDFNWRREAAKAGKPVDRREWAMTPQTVNAYYNPTLNEIVFPAAILQPPFYNPKGDDAVNYGGIGGVIGHEISHGFDDQGSQFDGDGALRNWWSDADRKAFEAVTSKLVAQYDAYEPLPGKHVNGRLTLGENIADLSGLQIAYKAYQRSLGGKPAPVIDGLTGAQRFFMGWSQAWREKSRDERRLQTLTVDPHSPPEFRANGAAVNHDGFHEAFKTKPGDKMYKAAGERIRIW